MRCYSILLACGLASLPSPAQVPDPGMMAVELANNAPAPAAANLAGGAKVTGVLGTEQTSSPLPVTAPTVVGTKDDGKSAQTPKTAVTLATVPVQPPVSGDEGGLAPPPEPKAAPLPVPATSPVTLRQDGDASSPAPKPDLGAASQPRTSVNVNRYDGTIRDSFGLVSVPAQKDVAEATPIFFQRVDYLRKHNDPILASAYLREIVMNGSLHQQDRAWAILELADCLSAQHQDAEALCWLRMWVELYPVRPEFGAVAYRVGTLYRQMGLPSMARDAYYLALAHAVNQGQVENTDDLKRYTQLTEGTLWELAANEYQSADWSRAAELFARYRQEATSASPTSQEKAAFLQADCYYQLRQTDKSISLYEETLKDHPFNPLAPQARLRLYHLYVLKNAPEKAQEELQALAWTVRTVWPQQETYWQRQTAELLLAINQKNIDVLPPLLQKSSQLPPEGKTWQDALDHYDALVSYQEATKHSITDTPANLQGKTGGRHDIAEETDLMAVNNYLNQLLPPPRTDSSP